MEAKIQDHSTTSNEELPGKKSDHHNKNTEDSTYDEKEEHSSQFNETRNSGEVRGYADKANNISTLNEDKSTISDTSAPSTNMQDSDRK